MAQTKADRKAAGQKAAATRKRNQTRSTSSTRGKKAASTSQARTARSSASDAKSGVNQPVGQLTTAAKAAGTAAKEAGKSVATRAGAVRGTKKK
jgi:hypothetical protein